MSGNLRVFYPIQALALGAYGSQSGLMVHGLQSVNITTSFNLEQVFELGQLNIYANLETLPSIEMSIEKAIDGYPLVYHLATQGATATDLLNRSNQRTDVFFSIYSDSQQDASGTPVIQAYCSGMYLNSLAYAIPVNGFARETVTLVGNDKIWITSSGTTWGSNKTGFAFLGNFNNSDTPASGIQRRQNVIFGNAAAGGSVLPKSIPGVTISNGSGYNVDSGSGFGAHIQDINISANLAREDLYELARRRPYYRYARFPVAIDCSINVTAGGSSPGDLVNANADIDNLTNEPIVIGLQDGSTFNLGTNNKLLSVTHNGGGVDGSPVQLTYAYQNFNFLVVTSPSDPMHL